jgi:murein L,D-transpeptidase YafK
MRSGRYSVKSLCLCLLLATAWTNGASAGDAALADRVVVHKSEHKLFLYSGDRLLGVYKVALGLSPVGQKERERDFKTPEGRYFLARRNTRSDYFLAIQVSYPNKDDELPAARS